MKLNKPQLFDGKWDYLVLNTLFYKLEQFLGFVELSSPGMAVTDDNRTIYAPISLTATGALWWYTLVKANQIPTTSVAFKTAIFDACVPDDHIRRAGDRLRKLHQTSSMSKYLSDFRNVFLTIPDMSNGEKWDKFCAGLKGEIRLKLMKTTVTSFKDAAKIALRVAPALWGSQYYANRGDAGNGNGGAPSSRNAGNSPTPVEIGNTEGRHSRFKDPKREGNSRNKLCFVFHKKGCRAWKHKGQKVRSVNNVVVEEDVVQSLVLCTLVGWHEHELGVVVNMLGRGLQRGCLLKAERVR